MKKNYKPCQKELLDFCKSSKILIQAYCPLTRGQKLDHPVVKEVSQKYNKSPAQVLIRWGLQHEILEIPKSASQDHIVENFNVFDFEIANEDMEKLDGLNENFRVEENPIFNE